MENPQQLLWDYVQRYVYVKGWEVIHIQTAYICICLCSVAKIQRVRQRKRISVTEVFKRLHRTRIEQSRVLSPTCEFLWNSKRCGWGSREEGFFPTYMWGRAPIRAKLAERLERKSSCEWEPRRRSKNHAKNIEFCYRKSYTSFETEANDLLIMYKSSQILHRWIENLITK